MTVNRFEVIVGNIGTVHRGMDRAEAMRHYNEYRDQSLNGYGRAAGEGVVLLKDDEIELELVGIATDHADFEEDFAL